MRIAHFCQLVNEGNPTGTSGMYLVTKDMIKYERRAGHESELVDPYHEIPDAEHKDGWLIPKPWKWAVNAEVWVVHRALPGPLVKVQKNHAMICPLHGPAMHMLQMEITSGGNSTNFNHNINMVWNYDRAVALCPNDYEIMRLFDQNNKLVYIQDAIDMEEHPLEGMTWEYSHHPAVVISDTVRETKFPAHILLAMAGIAERIPDARLNWLGFSRFVPGTYRNMMIRSANWKLMKLVETLISTGLNNLKPFLRGADIGFVNEINGRAGRTVPEKMACGIPVVSYDGFYTKYHARAWNIESIADAVEACWNDIQKTGRDKMREYCHDYAVKNFSMEQKVNDEYLPLYREVLEEKGLEQKGDQN